MNPAPGTAVDDDLEDGFTLVSRRRRNNRSSFTGRKISTNLRSVQHARTTRLFVSRLEPDVTANMLTDYIHELINDDCTVTRFTTRYPSYSSFLVSFDMRHKDTVMNPDEWGEGVLVRRYKFK